jgi:xylulokinase
VVPYFLGLDLGTTSCRCAVFDRDGRQVAAALAETAVQYPQPLWAEVEPEVWWAGTVRVLRAVLGGGAVAPDQIAAIGITGLMHAPILLDAAGQPVTPAMLWMDQRCAPQAEALQRQCEAAGLDTGRHISTTTSAPKLRWLADERPSVLAQAAHFMLPKDYLRYRLTGVAGTDPSDAGGTGLFDRERGEWHTALVRLCGLPASLLPPLRPAAALAGQVSAAAAVETGLRPGTPVAMGAADTRCTLLGAGAVAADEVCLYLGTAAWLAFLGGGGRPAIRGFGATATTGAALRWLRDLLTTVTGEDVSASYDALTREAAAVPPGAEGLLFLPHLMGERGPHADPLARGALVGLTLRHGRPQVVRAVLEGTAFHLRCLLEDRLVGRRPAAAVVCGGAARSPLWMQVLADVCAVPLRTLEVVEAGALGAAILGGAAAGLLTVEEAPARMVRVARRYTPDAVAAVRYNALFARYGRLDDLLAPWFREGEPAAAHATRKD